MAWRVVVQPNKYARFSDVVDCFTHMNLNRADIVDLCREYMGREDSENKVKRGEEDPTRWQDELRQIEAVYGRDKVDQIVQYDVTGNDYLD